MVLPYTSTATPCVSMTASIREKVRSIILFLRESNPFKTDPNIDGCWRDDSFFRNTSKINRQNKQRQNDVQPVTGPLRHRVQAYCGLRAGDTTVIYIDSVGVEAQRTAVQYVKLKVGYKYTGTFCSLPRSIIGLSAFES